MIGNPNKLERAALSRRMDTIMENCPCVEDSDLLDRRISTPGFDNDGCGTSLIACSLCGPVFRRAIDLVYGSSEEHLWPRQQEKVADDN